MPTKKKYTSGLEIAWKTFKENNNRLFKQIEKEKTVELIKDVYLTGYIEGMFTITKNTKKDDTK